MKKVRTWVLLAVALIASMSSVGCVPYSMGIFTPIPVPPWVPERMEEKFLYKNDFRTPILPPIRPGFPAPMCEDPPDEASILRALHPHVARGVPFIYEEFRDNYDVVPERIVDKIDPPRFFPLVGLAQLHHCHYKCIVYYTETIETMYPFPYKGVKQRVQVIMMDKDHLHLAPCGTPEAQRSITRDTVGY